MHDLFAAGAVRRQPARPAGPRHGRVDRGARRAPPIAGYYRRRYRPEHMVVAAAGNVDHAAVVRLVREAFERRPGVLDGDAVPGARRGWRGAHRGHGQRRPRRRPRHRAGQPRARRARPVAAPTSGASPSACSTPRSAAACRSRLFQEVREKRGLAYSVYSYTAQYADAGTVRRLRRLPAAQGRRGARPSAATSSPRSPSTASPTRSSRAARASCAARSCSASRTPASRMSRHRQGRAGLRRAARASTRCSPGSTRSPSTTCAPSPPSVLADAADPRGHRSVRRRRATSARRRLTWSRPDRLAPMSDVAVASARAGRMGAEAVPRGRGGRRPRAGGRARRRRPAGGAGRRRRPGRGRPHHAGRRDGQPADSASTHGIHVVVGTTRLRRRAARRRSAAGWRDAPGVGVLVAPNFAVGAVLMMRFAAAGGPVLRVRRDRRAAPPGQGRRAVAAPPGVRPADRRSPHAPPGWARCPDATTDALDGARGADVDGVPVHAVRLRGLVAHQEVLLGGDGGDPDDPARLASTARPSCRACCSPSGEVGRPSRPHRRPRAPPRPRLTPALRPPAPRGGRSTHPVRRTGQSACPSTLGVHPGEHLMC